MIEYLEPISLPLLRGPVQTCPYLPDQQARMQYALVADGLPRVYRRLMDERFRRSGDMVYRPMCPACSACVPIRVHVGEFRPSRSQRRVLSRNRDVTVAVGPLGTDDEHYDLYARYQLTIHDGQMLGSRADFEHFLGRSPVESFEMAYRVGGRLVGVGVIDAFADALSSVYFYYEPDEARRSLGVYSGLCEIEHCRRRGLAYWYIGYHVAGCRKMDYKAQFRPHELLGAGGAWTRGVKA
ncbi:MAG TPA: arginyltransferase [Phycisphaerae bacterium]|nr:arginyltransferase [Phycisphaerae bacterium]